MGDVHMALERGYLTKGCAFSSISNYMMNPEMTPVLNHLITLSAMPLKSVETKFAVGSTRFRTTTFSIIAGRSIIPVKSMNGSKHTLCAV